jgi:chaperonin GroES
MIKPLGDRVVIEAIAKEETTASGIVPPETAKEKPQEGKVVAVGAGTLKDGVRVPLEVQEGDRIIFSKYAGTEVKYEGRELLILRESDILAVLA